MISATVAVSSIEFRSTKRSSDLIRHRPSSRCEGLSILSCRVCSNRARPSAGSSSNAIVREAGEDEAGVLFGQGACAGSNMQLNTTGGPHSRVGAATRMERLGPLRRSVYNVPMDREAERQKSRRRAARRHQGPNHWHVEKRSSVVVCQACGTLVPRHEQPTECPTCGAGRAVGSATRSET